MHCQKQLGWRIFNNAIILYFAIESVSHSCDCCLFLGRQPTNISPPAPWNLVVCYMLQRFPSIAFFLLLTSPYLCLSMSRVCWVVFDNTWSFPGKSPAYIGDALLEDGTKLDVVAKRLLWGKFNNAGSDICNSNFLPMFTISLKVKYVWHLTTSSALRKWKNALCPCSQKIWFLAIIFN